MSTSQPKKDADEAPASEVVAEPGPPDAAPAAETAAETKAETKPETEAEAQPDAAAAPTTADEPVWPPPESQPTEASLAAATAGPDVLTKPDEPSPAAKPDEPSPAAKPDEPAAEPNQEMGLSESTLHWLVDGEQPLEASEPNPILMPVYDRRAPVAGRKRTFAIIGGAAVLALGIAWALHAQAERHQAAAVASTDDSADVLFHRAEAALAQGRSAEALDLARLAIVTDPRLANAYIIMGAVQRSNGQVIDARDSYRRYLELAPIGTHAAEARAALATLPP